jgi:hypothetical protein
LCFLKAVTNYSNRISNFQMEWSIAPSAKEIPCQTQARSRFSFHPQPMVQPTKQARHPAHKNASLTFISISAALRGSLARAKEGTSASSLECLAAVESERRNSWRASAQNLHTSVAAKVGSILSLEAAWSRQIPGAKANVRGPASFIFHERASRYLHWKFCCSLKFWWDACFNLFLMALGGASWFSSIINHYMAPSSLRSSSSQTHSAQHGQLIRVK